MRPKIVCRHFVKLQMLLQICSHAAIYVREDMRRSIMQRVIQIKNPQWAFHTLLALDQRAHAFVGENFQQQSMLNPAVDDVHGTHPSARRIQCGSDLGQHPA